MKWSDVHPDVQSTWLSDPTTIAYLDRLREERGRSHDSALTSMRAMVAAPETLTTAARRVGEMDAYQRAIEIATRTE